ncbi:MAG: hypothetical protein IPG99_10820 [Ignavibacteria bacterium]|nr:hypothetical protein [Ignavibacteria bacterium]
MVFKKNPIRGQKLREHLLKEEFIPNFKRATALIINIRKVNALDRVDKILDNKYKTS